MVNLVTMLRAHVLGKEGKSMFRKLGHKVLGSCAAVVMLVAGLAVQPASLITWYQPEVPKVLRK
jgi:cyclic lactone autoinducer peptide